MEKKALLYEGKAKKVYETDDKDMLIVDYKDDATAFNGEKKGTIQGKGVINNRCSNILFKYLSGKGIETHLVEEISDRESIVKKVEIVPLEVIIRNVAAGSFSKRYGVAEGTKLLSPVFELSYKNDDLGDPLINDFHVLALGLATRGELDTIQTMALNINEYMKEFWSELGIDLIDFKLEFGRYHGRIILADEMSPDTCRFWDKKTGEKLDKDRFRRDLGGVEDAYAEIMKRVDSKNAE